MAFASRNTSWLWLIAWVSLAVAGDQSQWGQRWSRNMVSDEKNLPETFDLSMGRNVKWSAQLGTETYSTPVIAQGRVYIGSNNGHSRDPRQQGDRGVLMCFAEATGEFLWQLAVPKLLPTLYRDWPNAGICSPVTVEGDCVYVVSNRGEVLCLDARGQTNGNDGPYMEETRHAAPDDSVPMALAARDADIVWLYDIVKELKIRQHDSAHCSILLHGRFLYVNTSNGVDDTHKKITAPDAPSLIVLDKTTGRLVATDNEHIGPRIFHSTWSSPALGEIQGRPLVFFGGGDGVVYAFEPVKTAPPAGEVLPLKKVWQFDGDPNAPKENVHRFNGNRRESPSNIKSMPVFFQNRVYVTLGGDLWWGKTQAWIKCIDATKTGDISATGEIWSYPLTQHCMSTPAIGEGLVFVADCGRKIHCLDANTGQPYWVHETPGEIWASTLIADGKVYIGTRSGDFLVFAASKEKRLLATLPLGEPMHPSPVAANGVLYVATMSRLYALQQSAKP